jgi:hypothetical protein
VAPKSSSESDEEDSTSPAPDVGRGACEDFRRHRGHAGPSKRLPPRSVSELGQTRPLLPMWPGRMSAVPHAAVHPRQSRTDHAVSSGRRPDSRDGLSGPRAACRSVGSSDRMEAAWRFRRAAETRGVATYAPKTFAPWTERLSHSETNTGSRSTPYRPVMTSRNSTSVQLLTFKRHASFVGVAVLHTSRNPRNAALNPRMPKSRSSAIPDDESAKMECGFHSNARLTDRGLWCLFHSAQRIVLRSH